MSDLPKSIQLAVKIWPKLMILAERRSTITYTDLGEPLGIRGQALQSFDRILNPIRHYCLQHNLPPLSALVVRKDSGLPGSGVEADETDIDRIYAYNWRGRSPIIPSAAELAAAMERGKSHE
jgi:hypothetical protein